MGSLQQLKFILPQIWRPEVCRRGGHRATFPLEDAGENRSCFLQLPEAPGIRWLWLRYSLCLCLYMAFSSLCLCLLCLTRILVPGFTACPDNPRRSHLEICNLITSVNILFPNKVTFTGVKMWTHLLGGHRSTHYRWQTRQMSFKQKSCMMSSTLSG